MNDYFYYIGFIYIAFVIKDLFERLKLVQKENIVKVENGMGVAGLSDMMDKANKDNTPKFRMNIIVNFLLFCWVIFGYLIPTPEKNWFLAEAIIIVSNQVFIVLLGIYISYVALLKPKTEIFNIEKKKPINLNLGLFSNIAELIIVSYILYLHFAT